MPSFLWKYERNKLLDVIKENGSDFVPIDGNTCDSCRIFGADIINAERICGLINFLLSMDRQSLFKYSRLLFRNYKIHAL